MSVQTILFSAMLCAVMLLAGSGTVQAEPLHGAASAGDVAKVQRRFLRGGANIDAKDKHGWAALTITAGNGHTEAAELLFKSGADVDAKEKYGRTALDCARAGNHKDVVKLLETARE